MTMKKTIEMLTEIFGNANGDLVEASKVLSDQQPRFTEESARLVMMDIKDFEEEKISETKLSLFLVNHGF